MKIGEFFKIRKLATLLYIWKSIKKSTTFVFGTKNSHQTFTDCIFITNNLVSQHVRCTCNLWDEYTLIFQGYLGTLTQLNGILFVSSPKFYRLCVWMVRRQIGKSRVLLGPKSKPLWSFLGTSV